MCEDVQGISKAAKEKVKRDEDNQAGVGKQPMVPRVNEMRENLVTMEIKDGQLT